MRALRLDLWLPPVVLMGVIFFLSHQPDLGTGLGTIDLIARKIVHFAEYALLGFLWWRALITVTTPSRAVALAFLLASGYAATDEYHQTFIDGRHGSPLDWAIDSAGAGAAAIGLRKAGRREKLAA